jgi:two-component system OmpR family sensor kinase
MNSVRGRLLAWLMAGLSLALLPTGVAAYLKAREEVNLLLDYQLKETALSLRRQSLLAAAMAREFDSRGEEGDVVVQIWDQMAGLMYVSRADRELPLIPLEGFHDVSWQGREWRAYVLRAGSRTIQVAQPLGLRSRLSADIAFRNMVPYLALVPFAGAIVWFGVGFGLRPLRRVAEAVGRRRPDALDPLPSSGLPEEIRPLAESLNDLLVRLDHAFSAQRQFVADAAHELRTPLTALQLQLQNLEGTDEAQRAAAIRELRAGLKRAARLVEQLLAMARLDPDAPLRSETVDLEALAKGVVAEMSVHAEARNIDLGVLKSAPVSIAANPDDLRLLLRNLVDNAVRYTPEGGRVDVLIKSVGPDALLEVADTGPGIPAAERERVFDRFYRGSGADVPGSGLGLAIVKRVTERHGGSILLAEGEGGRGLRVTVRLPVVRPLPG